MMRHVLIGTALLGVLAGGPAPAAAQADADLDYAANVRERGSFPPADAPKEVRVLEVMDQIAAARVTAWWGSDYLQLAKYDGAWKIVHVLWQTPSAG